MKSQLKLLRPWLSVSRRGLFCVKIETLENGGFIAQASVL